MITNPLAVIALVLATILFVPMVCRKIRIPSIVGFIIVGMIVGPYGFNLLTGGNVIQTLGKIGMLYIMLQAGIEVDINDFRQQRTHAIVYGIYSFLFPFVLGLLTSKLLGFGWVTSTLMGAMYGSHTLMTYPIVSRYGVQKNPAANIAIDYNIQGPSFTVSTACSSGGDAINTAIMCMQTGKADVMLAVGAESVLCPLVIYSLANAKALSRRNDDPKTASRPFDVTRDGFVIGEGGGALVLETEEHALKRGAKIYGVIEGCGNTCDAHHVTAPHPEGRGAIACMKQALAEAGLSPDDIGYINAHGTATNKGDAVETGAIKSVFTGKLPFVSSTKGATGHMMGAGGITEAIACIKAIETGTLPPTINLHEVDPECDGIDFVPNTAKEAKIDHAMSNAFGFGGQNSSIIVGRYESIK